MRDAEKKVQAFMGKVDGAKKFAKNLADVIFLSFTFGILNF